MDNAGVFDLCVLGVTPDFAMTLLLPEGGAADVSGMTAVSLDLKFKYGSGGTSCFVIAVTTFDNGETWRTVKRWELGTADRDAYCNLEGLLSIDRDYTDLLVTAGEGKNDGALGHQLAVYVQSVGNYSNTTLAVRASVR